MVHVSDVIGPDMKAHSLYLRMFDAYRKAYAGLSRECYAAVASIEAPPG